MKIYTAENIRQWDRFTIENEPISSIDLMERAASRCTEKIVQDHSFQSAAIFCGIGNNGGDGLVIARLLHKKGISVTVYIVNFSPQRSADFSANLERLSPETQLVQLTESNFRYEIHHQDLVIDAIFGSGLNRPVNGWIGEVITGMNNGKKPIISIDIPSGLFIEKNDYSGSIVRANQTITFQTPKFSFFFPESEVYVGNWDILDIGLHPGFSAPALATFCLSEDIKLHQRSNFSHKGDNGFLTVVAGFGDMGGAAILCGSAGFRTGSGYVGIIGSEEYFPSILTQLPEALLFKPVDLCFPNKTKAIAIGPGLGKSDLAKTYLNMALKAGLPLVLDADALNLLAEDPTLQAKIPVNAILTPHTAELERIIGKFDSSEDRLAAQIEYSINHNVFILQKGAWSKLSCPDGGLVINSTGNSGMATAGMGDVLTGIIGSFLAQGYSPQEAATYGMYFHGLAGDHIAEKEGKRGMISSDVVRELPYVMKDF